MSSQEEGVEGEFGVGSGLEVDIQERRRAAKVARRAITITRAQPRLVPATTTRGRPVMLRQAPQIIAGQPAFVGAIPAIARAAAPVVQRFLPTIGAGAAGGAAAAIVGELLEPSMRGIGGGARFAVVDLTTGMIIKRISARRALLLTRRNPIRTRTRVIRAFCPHCRSNPCVCG